MELTAVILFRGALAYYSVAVKDDGAYLAGLLKYKGDIQELPPENVLFKKDGRHCTGNTEEQELMDDIYNAVQSKMYNKGLLSPDNSKNSPFTINW